MLTKIFSATTTGLETHLVQVEVDLAFGLLQFHIVGLPDAAIKESKQRIQTALKNCGIKLPEKKITVNLAPADLKKEGTIFDLPISVGIMIAAKFVEQDSKYIEETLFLGELSLDGTIKPVHGILPIAFDAEKFGKKRIILSKLNAQEAALIKNIEVIGVTNLVELIALLKKEITISPATIDYTQYEQKADFSNLNFSQVKGQFAAKRALQIAAAGRHNILFVGSPGSGKTMLAKRLASIMPEMEFDEILQTSKIYSVCGKLEGRPLVTSRPFRNPHHTISQAGLVGGGSFPQPGEISLAHNGILFLDELTEFKRDVLEVLRQPIEYQNVSIARAQQTVTFPANFLLIAALNPCPCGFAGDKKRDCKCTAQQVAKYIGKLSGPLLDRIDLQVNVASIDYDTLTDKTSSEYTSERMHQAVNKAAETQKVRNKSGHWNAHLSVDQIDLHCKLSPDATALVKKAFEKLHLTMRGYHKLLKVSRTIADLESCEIIDVKHIKEALLYRSIDQNISQTGGT